MIEGDAKDSECRCATCGQRLPHCSLCGVALPVDAASVMCEKCVEFEDDRAAWLAIEEAEKHGGGD